VIVSLLVLSVDLRGAIGFSSFRRAALLVIANASALTQVRENRRYPQAVQVLGCLGCSWSWWQRCRERRSSVA